VDEERPPFLPPEPAGPEPELGGPPPPPPPQGAGPQQGWQPPAHAGQAPAHAGQAHPPGATGPGWQQASPAGWAYPPRPAEPDNGAAVAGFVLALVSGGLLLVTLGASSVISVACAIFGLVYSRRGRRRVQAGETRRHAGLAQAGFIISIVSLVLAAIATLAYIALIIAYATDESFREDIDNGSLTVRTAVTLFSPAPWRTRT
jgi:hypothetical protein